MAKYGVPGYRLPRTHLDGEIGRITSMGVEVRTEDAHRHRRQPGGTGIEIRRGAAGPGLQGRQAPSRARWRCAQLHQRRRRSSSVQPGAAEGRRGAGRGGGRRRHLDRRRVGGAAPRLRAGHQGVRAAGVRGDGPHRARRLDARRAAGRRRHAHVPAARRGDERGEARNRGRAARGREDPRQHPAEEGARRRGDRAGEGAAPRRGGMGEGQVHGESRAPNSMSRPSSSSPRSASPAT